MSGVLRKVLGHGSDSRADLKDAVILCDSRRGDDLLQYMGIDQKVLTELFLKHEFILLYDFYGILWVSQIRHLFLSFYFGLRFCAGAFIYANNEPKSALARDLGDCRDNKGKLAKRVFTCCMSCILYTKFDTIPISQSDRSDRPETPIL